MRQRTLSGRVAIVTGGGRGIGRAIAFALAEHGADVVVAARTLTEIKETAAEICAGGHSAIAVGVDVSDWQSVERLVDRTLREFADIHILVNNAGMQGPIGSLVENATSEWEHTVRVNLMGTFLCCKAVLPSMIKQRWGRIVNLSGGGATSPRPYFSAYAASKAAVVRLTETLAEEVQAFNVQVNAIAPGAVNTAMLDAILAAGDTAGRTEFSEAQRRFEAGGTPPNLAAALTVFLASDKSAGLTGKLIAAPYDDWHEWDSERIEDLMTVPWFTLRRVDSYTLTPLVGRLKKKVG
ncbi:SDR family NAD(P)-dependent oxidoreductase [Chloroflexota bacterium]